MAAGARPGLWPRDARSPNGLVLRVGVTDQAPSVRLHGSPGDDLEVPVLHGVPVTVDLRETGVLGVIGTGEPAPALLRWLIVQLATLRSPDDLRLVLLTCGDAQDDGDARGAGDLRWARWLPHLDGGGTAETPCLIGNTDASRAARVRELRQLITARVAERGGPAPAPSGAWPPAMSSWSSTARSPCETCRASGTSSCSVPRPACTWCAPTARA